MSAGPGQAQQCWMSAAMSKERSDAAGEYEQGGQRWRSRCHVAEVALRNDQPDTVLLLLDDGVSLAHEGASSGDDASCVAAQRGILAVVPHVLTVDASSCARATAWGGAVSS